MELQEFTDKLWGRVVYGLDESMADKLISQGIDMCDYFEETVLAMMYEEFKKLGCSFEEFEKGHPQIVRGVEPKKRTKKFH